jgi:serine protease Do
MPCVVAISNIGEVKYQGMWGQTYTQQTESAGTGFLVEQDADYIYIASNNHVVAGAKELTVQFSDGTTAKAEIKGTVASKDLAVIKVALKDISTETLNTICLATLGDSTKLEAGEPAIAIGNALGYGQSVTTGVISALGRSVSVQDSSTGTTVVNNNLIQTDAAINPGNSGGALLNVKGEVIGINSVKYAQTEVEGIGYAIPINDAMLIIDKMIDGEKIDESQSGYLGIQGKDCSLGAYVHAVLPGSAAQKAGMKEGDIIVAFEGTTIATMSQLKELLSYYPAGAEVEFEILRPLGNDEYEEIKIIVKLGDASILS